VIHTKISWIIIYIYHMISECNYNEIINTIIDNSNTIEDLIINLQNNVINYEHNLYFYLKKYNYDKNHLEKLINLLNISFCNELGDYMARYIIYIVLSKYVIKLQDYMVQDSTEKFLLTYNNDLSKLEIAAKIYDNYYMVDITYNQKIYTQMVINYIKKTIENEQISP